MIREAEEDRIREMKRREAEEDEQRRRMVIEEAKEKEQERVMTLLEKQAEVRRSAGVTDSPSAIAHDSPRGSPVFVRVVCQADEHMRRLAADREREQRLRKEKRQLVKQARVRASLGYVTPWLHALRRVSSRVVVPLPRPHHHRLRRRSWRTWSDRGARTSTTA